MVQSDIEDRDTDIDDKTSLKHFIQRMQYWWAYLKRKWKLILLAFLVCAALGLTYSFLKKPVYDAGLSFAIQDDNSTGGKLGAAVGLASQFGIDLSGSNIGGAFSGDNLLELLRSRAMVEKALLTSVTINGKQETLAELYITFNKLRERWGDDPALKNVQFLPNADRSKFTLSQDSLLGVFYHTLLKKNLNVDKVDKDLSIVTIKVETKNELFSKYFTEAMAKTVSDFYIQSKTQKSAQNLNVLQKLTDSVRRELNAAITGVATTADANPNANPTLQILKVPSQRRQVDVEANGAMLTELVKNLELAKISLRKETPLIQIIDTPILPLEEKKVSKPIAFIVGGIIGALLMVMNLLIRARYREIMEEK
jgi:hypothetical protein